MSLPDPFDFRDSDSDGPEGESTNHDLLQKFHSTERRGLKRDAVKRQKDRRLNFMRHYCDNESDGEGMESCATSSKRLGLNSNLSFLGEQLVSSPNHINDPVSRMHILTPETVRYRCSSDGSWENTTIPSCVGPADSEPGLVFPNFVARHTMPHSQCLNQALRRRSQNCCISVAGKASYSMIENHLLITLMSASPSVGWTTRSSGGPHSFEW